MIALPSKYYLVINDRFELFFRGVIMKHNPYQYYVKAECKKGYTYNRYFTYTPEPGEEGEYELTINVIDDDGAIIESKSTILVVNNIEAPYKKMNVLCVGDSETVNGVWPYTGYKKFVDVFPDSLNFIGKMHKEEVGYEGYGGWQWKTFCEYEDESRTSSVWVTCNHHLTEADQHSTWKNNDLEWIVETIEENRIKFKRGEGNCHKVNPELKEEFTHVAHAEHKDAIKVIKYEYSDANPFWNPEKKDIDFKYYIKKNNLAEPDLLITFLTGNGLYIPYHNDFPVHREYATKFLRQFHNDFPNALIGVMGVELPCCNGGVTACYGASGYYHDWYGDTITKFNYDKWLELFTKLDEFKDYMIYFDTKSQFDSEYSYPVELQKVNNRSEIVERLGVNGLHPSIDGYKQIGDAFYRLLVEIIKKANKINSEK